MYKYILGDDVWQAMRVSVLKYCYHSNIVHWETDTPRSVYSKEKVYSKTKTELKCHENYICLKKSEVSDDRISVCNAIANLTEHGILCLLCSNTNGVIKLLP